MELGGGFCFLCEMCKMKLLSVLQPQNYLGWYLIPFAFSCPLCSDFLWAFVKLCESNALFFTTQGFLDMQPWREVKNYTYVN